MVSSARGRNWGERKTQRLRDATVAAVSRDAQASSSGFTTNTKSELGVGIVIADQQPGATPVSTVSRLGAFGNRTPFDLVTPAQGAGCVRLLGHCAWQQLLCAPGVEAQPLCR